MSPLFYQIGLTLIKGIGPILAKNLITYIGDVESIFKESPKNLRKIPDIGPILSKEISTQDVLRKAEKEINFILKNNINTHYYLDKNYPLRLKECIDAPILFFSKGNFTINPKRCIGVVGTRKPTIQGRNNCESFINDLKEISPDCTIISGLAYGVDICAHKTALNNHLPTIAALGHGLDRIYPALHRATAIQMLENGGLLTEYLSNTNPDKQNFVQRNRLIAGICDAVIVVESGKKGGSLITAKLAQSYNRDIFAFPGRINDELSAGCNQLIKDNQAGLIESASDFAKAMCWEVQKNSGKNDSQLLLDLNDHEEIIVGILKKEECSINELAKAVSLPISKTSSLLLKMEFKGIVKCLPGSLYCIKK